jgi:hypothetical protein
MMKLDRFADFMLPREVREFLTQYPSPDSEVSIAKDIPMDQLDRARRMMRIIETLTGRKMRVIYRGPRRDHGRSWCLRQDARRFAIYFR